MNTVTENFVSFETAKLLREKGFNEKVICYYNDGGSLNLNKFVEFQCCNQGCGSSIFAAPTLQMVCKLLREIYNIDILPQVYYLHVKCYRCMITNGVETITLQEPKFFYEEAVETAIKYSLENLI